MSSIISKNIDFENLCEKIETTFTKTSWYVVGEIHEVLLEYRDIKKELERITKQLKKLNVEEVEKEDDLPF